MSKINIAGKNYKLPLRYNKSQGVLMTACGTTLAMPLGGLKFKIIVGELLADALNAYGENERLRKVLDATERLMWIPVESKDDLPEESGRYLFTVENANGERKAVVMNLRQVWNGQKIVAWRPLPNPYEVKG